MIKNKFPSEEQLQASCVQWLEIQRLQKKLIYFSIPNGGFNLSKRSRYALQRTGRRPGVPDMAIAWFPAKLIFVEFKAQNGSLSADQKEMHAQMRFFGLEVFVVKTLEHLINLVTEKKGTT